MNQESIDFLEKNRHHWELFERVQVVQHLDAATRQGWLSVIQKEFNPGYFTDLWCPTCVVELMRYTYTQYDKWKEQNKTPS